MSLPWLRYVKDTFYKIGLEIYYDNPDGIQSNMKQVIKNAFRTEFCMSNQDYGIPDCVFRSQQQFYLSFTMHVQSCFLMTRFHLCTLHFLVAFPKEAGWCERLTPCPCINLAHQSTMHFMLFCTLYKDPRERFIKPILKEIRPCSYQEGFIYLRSLTTAAICSAVLNFIRTAF